MIKSRTLFNHLLSFFLAASLTACGGGGDSPPPPMNEGSMASPVDLGVASAPLWRIGTVGAYGSSYYWFTTGSLAGSHAISLTGTRSDLSWDLLGWDSVAGAWVRLQTCANYIGRADEICSTPSLAPNSDYYVVVDEWDGVAGSYTLAITPP